MPLPHFQNNRSSKEELDERIKESIKKELKEHPDWLNEILVELREEKLKNIIGGIK